MSHSILFAQTASEKVSPALHCGRKDVAGAGGTEAVGVAHCVGAVHAHVELALHHGLQQRLVLPGLDLFERLRVVRDLSKHGERVSPRWLLFH